MEIEPTAIDAPPAGSHSTTGMATPQPASAPAAVKHHDLPTVYDNTRKHNADSIVTTFQAMCEDTKRSGLSLDAKYLVDELERPSMGAVGWGGRMGLFGPHHQAVRQKYGATYNGSPVGPQPPPDNSRTMSGLWQIDHFGVHRNVHYLSSASNLPGTYSPPKRRFSMQESTRHSGGVSPHQTSFKAPKTSFAPMDQIDMNIGGAATGTKRSSTVPPRRSLQVRSSSSPSLLRGTDADAPIDTMQAAILPGSPYDVESENADHPPTPKQDHDTGGNHTTSNFYPTDTEDDTLGDSATTHHHSRSASVLPHPSHQLRSFSSMNNAQLDWRCGAALQGQADRCGYQHPFNTIHHNAYANSCNLPPCPEGTHGELHCCVCDECSPPDIAMLTNTNSPTSPLPPPFEARQHSHVPTMETLLMRSGVVLGGDNTMTSIEVSPPSSPAKVTDMIVIEDCCYNMNNPCVLDLKMGLRQYGLNPTEEKKASKTAKAKKSTTGSLGVRIGGMKLFTRERGEELESRVNIASSTPSALVCKRVEKKTGMGMSVDQFVESLESFCSADQVQDGDFADRPSTIGDDAVWITLKARFVELLKEFRAAFASQNEFRFFTSSLLMVYDANPTSSSVVVEVEGDDDDDDGEDEVRLSTSSPTSGNPISSSQTQRKRRYLSAIAATAKLVMIDFAFTYHVDELRAYADEDGFTPCDEGYVKGIDSLIRILQETSS